MSRNLNIQSIWLFLVFFAFFYELPLVNLSFDRLNPRLIDVVTLIGVALYGGKLGIHVKNTIYSKWKSIVFWFVFCSVLSSLFLLSGSNKLFSLLAAFRYLEGLLLIKLVLVSEINKRTILWALLSGLLFDALYCVYQYGHPVTRQLAPGVYIDVNTLTGPLSTSYFEIAQLLPTAALFALGLIPSVINRKSYRIFLYIAVVVCTWPLLFTGSRTGLVLAIVAFLGFLLLQGRQKLMLLVIVVGLSWSLLNSINMDNTELYTISRTFDLEEADKDDVGERISVGTSFSLTEYDNALALPIIGAGFNVAPVNGSPRIDYGIHSMYLYPLEQSGIVGLFLFLSFLYICIKAFNKQKNWNKVSLGAMALLLSMMVTGIGAHNFWREFSSGNVNTLIVLFFCLAYKFSNEENKSIAHQ